MITIQEGEQKIRIQSVAYQDWGGGLGVIIPPPHPSKLRSFGKAEPNFQFRGKYNTTTGFTHLQIERNP
jgi:hypothetical protein